MPIHWVSSYPFPCMDKKGNRINPFFILFCDRMILIDGSYNHTALHSDSILECNMLLQPFFFLENFKFLIFSQRTDWLTCFVCKIISKAFTFSGSKVSLDVNLVWLDVQGYYFLFVSYFIASHFLSSIKTSSQEGDSYQCVSACCAWKACVKLCIFCIPLTFLQTLPFKKKKKKICVLVHNLCSYS